MSVSWTAALSPAEYLTARSSLCRFATSMSLKHAHMGVSRTAARSPLNTWQPDQMHYAGFDQKCQNEREQNSCALLALTARSRPWQPDRVCAGFEQTCHLNMPTWMWAEQLHRPCPDSQITCVRVSSKPANTWAWAVTAAPSCWIADSQITSMQFSNKHAT